LRNWKGRGRAACGAQTGGASAAEETGAERRNFSAPLKNIAFSLNTEIVRREAPAVNVVGLLEGSDPKLKGEFIVVGAHYDHLGRGGQGSLAAREGEVHHGADDNASGVAGLLELARTFAQERKSMRRSILFIAFRRRRGRLARLELLRAEFNCAARADCRHDQSRHDRADERRQAARRRRRHVHRVEKLDREGQRRTQHESYRDGDDFTFVI
jgi:hypothetical protein